MHRLFQLFYLLFLSWALGRETLQKCVKLDLDLLGTKQEWGRDDVMWRVNRPNLAGRN